MATTSLDYMGGTPYAAIKVDFSIPVGYGVVAICNLTDTSSGILTYTASTWTSTWSVNGQTVTKISGNATSIAYYVTNGVLYAQNQSTGSIGVFAGEIENVIIRVDTNVIGAPGYYNANTDYTVQANKTDAVAHICSLFLVNYPNENEICYSVRYAGGYYANYILTRCYYASDPTILVREYGIQSAIGKLSLYTYNIANGTADLKWALT